MVRLKMRIRPERKLLMMVCMPKPIPTDRPPATMARLLSSMPSERRVNRPKNAHRA